MAGRPRRSLVRQRPGCCRAGSALASCTRTRAPPIGGPPMPWAPLPRARSFEKYGGLSASLRDILDAPPDIDMDEYRARTRVQVGGPAPARRQPCAHAGRQARNRRGRCCCGGLPGTASSWTVGLKRPAPHRLRTLFRSPACRWATPPWPSAPSGTGTASPRATPPTCASPRAAPTPAPSAPSPASGARVSGQRGVSRVLGVGRSFRAWAGGGCRP